MSGDIDYFAVSPHNVRLTTRSILSPCRRLVPRIARLALRPPRSPAECPALDERKTWLEQELRAHFPARAPLESVSITRVYQAYYRRFKKTYHVLLQLDSIVTRGKPIPWMAALVEALFMAEVRNQLLTAGHDLDGIRRFDWRWRAAPSAICCAGTSRRPRPEM